MNTPIRFNSSDPSQTFAELARELKSSGKDVNEFAQLMLESIGHVNAIQQDSNRAVELLATGGDIQAAEVLTSIQKADMTFRLMLQIRNKLMQAYQEINDIRI